VIDVPEDQQARKDFLQATTDGGWAIDLGVNFHMGKWYVGVFGQYIRLNASGSYDYILTSDFVTEELTDQEKEVIDQYLNSPLALFVDFGEEIALHTNLYQLGLKIGRQFKFKNPRWDCRIELGFSKNMSSNTTSTHDEALIQSIIDAEDMVTAGSNNLEERLDFNARLEEIDDFFHEYGYIPTLDIGFSFQLNNPKKDRKKEIIKSDEIIE